MRDQQEKPGDGAESVGGMMPHGSQRVAREAQRENGSIWRKELVRVEEVEAGSLKLNGPSRQTEGCKRGTQSAQAMY